MFYRKPFVLLSLIVLVVATLALASLALNRVVSSTKTPEQQPKQSRQKSQRQVKNLDQPRQHTENSTQEENLAVSPNQAFAISSEPYDPYMLSPEPQVFAVLDAKTGNHLRRIPVFWAARYVASVEWINDRFVAVRGEAGFLTVLDIEAGKQTHNLRGNDFNISPDGTQIVFSHDFNPRYGYIPPEYESNYVLFSLVKRHPTSSRAGDKYSFVNQKVVYPDSFAWDESVWKAYDDLDDRHQIKSTFAWSKDSQKVAFVETHRGKLWLVVLQPKVQGEDVTVDSQKVELGASIDNISLLSWVSNSNQIKVSDDLTTLLVDLDTITVQPVPSDR